MTEHDDIIREFLLENYEGLDQFDRDLVELERDATDLEPVASAFRVIHTIKGACGLLGFSGLERVTHAGESLLSRIRDGQIHASADVIDLLLKMSDLCRRMLDAIDQNGADAGIAYEELFTALERHAKLDASKSDAGDAGLPAPQPASPETHPDLDAAPTDQHRAITDSRVRVDVAALDRLMDLVGELVLTRNQLVTYRLQTGDEEVGGIAHRLDVVTKELQEGVMDSRMQPIRDVWNRLPRLTRDLAHACRKQVQIQMTGGDTELDRSILEALRDPLVHLIRNSIDHGIEPAELRQMSGKPAEGRICVDARHEGGAVIIEVSDDGAGLDLDALRHKAIHQELIDETEARELSDDELAQLIFRPGFSTAARVTNVSGRGVGMDAVKTNVERIGGSIQTSTREGEGVTHRLQIPLTLAIIPALIVRIGEDRYAIPQIDVSELVHVDPKNREQVVEYVHDAPVLRLRKSLLPLVHLPGLMQDSGDEADPPSETFGDVNVVAVGADDQRFGLIADEILDIEDIVVKPLDYILGRDILFSGATILGDGRPTLILDVSRIARRSKAANLESRRATDVRPEESADERELTQILLFESDLHGRMGVRLSHVLRLDACRTSQIEFAGSQEVIQVRGEILPLVRPSAALPERRSRNRHEFEDSGSRAISVVVCNIGDQLVGLVALNILDIVPGDLSEVRAATRQGVECTLILDEHVTEVLDLEWLAQHSLLTGPGTSLELN